MNLEGMSSENHQRHDYPRLSQGARGFCPRDWRAIQSGLKLSAREVQIVQGIFDDKLEYGIAVELGVSINTIRTQLRRLRQKLKTADRVCVVLRVVEEFHRQNSVHAQKKPAACPYHAGGACPLWQRTQTLA